MSPRRLQTLKPPGPVKRVLMHLAKIATNLLGAGPVTGSITYHQVLDGLKPVARAAATIADWVVDHQDEVRDASNQTKAWTDPEPVQTNETRPA
jgi:hypothetical protein